MYNKIIVPLDLSKTAEAVLPCARYLAHSLKIPVELLTVIDIAEIARHVAAEKAQALQTLPENALLRSETYLRMIAATFQDPNVKIEVERGFPDETIIKKGEADNSILIAMATHGRSGLNRFLLGSIAEKVLRGTGNPLLLVRATEELKSEEQSAFRTIIVPLDGSEVAERVLHPAAELAKKLGAEILLFRVYHIPYTALSADEAFLTIDYDELVASVRDEANRYLENKATELKSSGVKNVSFLAKEGFSADEIIGLARHSPDSLIAMSSHGRSGVKRLVLGSVTENVVRHTKDPVLVVRAG